VVDVQQVTVSMLKQSVGKLKELQVPIIGTIMNRLGKYNNYHYYGYSKNDNYYYNEKA